MMVQHSTKHLPRSLSQGSPGLELNVYPRADKHHRTSKVEPPNPLSTLLTTLQVALVNLATLQKERKQLLNSVNILRDEAGIAAIQMKLLLAQKLSADPQCRSNDLLRFAHEHCHPGRKLCVLLAKEAVCGPSAHYIAQQVMQENIAARQSSEVALTQTLTAFTRVHGPAFLAGQVAYASYRSSYPKDLTGALQAGRKAYASNGGFKCSGLSEPELEEYIATGLRAGTTEIGYDPIPEIIENESFRVVKDILQKVVGPSLISSEDKADVIETATKAYKQVLGKRSTKFIPELLKYLLIEKSFEVEIRHTIQHLDAIYKLQEEAFKEKCQELEKITTQDLTDGRRPG